MKPGKVLWLVIAFAFLEIAGMNAYLFLEDKETIKRWYHIHVALTTLTWSFVVEELARYVYKKHNTYGGFALWVVSVYIVLLKILNLVDELLGVNTIHSKWEWIGFGMVTIFIAYFIKDQYRKR